MKEITLCIQENFVYWIGFSMIIGGIISLSLVFFYGIIKVIGWDGLLRIFRKD